MTDPPFRQRRLDPLREVLRHYVDSLTKPVEAFLGALFRFEFGPGLAWLAMAAFAITYFLAAVGNGIDGLEALAISVIVGTFFLKYWEVAFYERNRLVEDIDLVLTVKHRSHESQPR